MHIEQLSPFAGRVTDINLSHVTPAQAESIKNAMDQHGVLVFPGQHIGQDEQIAFAKSLGPLELGFRKIKTGGHRLKYNELADISNVTVEGEVAGRDHNKNAFSVWFAGAGIRGGTTHGSTDDLGLNAVENRVSVPDWHATMLHLLGLDHEQLFVLDNGLKEKLTGVQAARVVREIFK
jgi:hypothetical protein